MTTFISIRVSTQEQARDGVSLPVQVRECLAYCKQHGFDLHPTATNVDEPGVFCDPGVSAWKIPIFNRPGFNELWKHARKGDRIVFLSFDRAFRSTRDFLNSWDLMQKTGVAPVFCRQDIRMDTAAGQLWARTVASFAEYQSAVMSERIREAFAIKKHAGIEKRDRAKSVSESKPMIQDEIQRLYRPKDLCKLSDAPKGRVFAYARVSTSDQDIEPQVIRLESGIEYRVQNGYTRGGMFMDDGVSAFYRNFSNRPAGAKIWSELRSGDVIICTKLDRIFRSTLDMAQVLKTLNEIGVTITTLDGSISTETPEGQAIASYLCIMAQWESESISWRTRLALDSVCRARGPWTQKNRHPFWIKRIEVDGGQYRLEVVADVVRDVTIVQELRRSGMPMLKISDEIQKVHETEFDFPSSITVPRGGFQSRKSLTAMLRSRRQFDDVKRLDAYCDRFEIGERDAVDRAYSIVDGTLNLMQYYAREDGLLSRYITENDGDMGLILEASGVQ